MTDTELDPLSRDSAAQPQAAVAELSPEEPDAPAAPEGDDAPTGPVVFPAEPGPHAVSPDSASFAYIQRAGSGRLGLWISPVDGGGPHRLDTPVEFLDESAEPQWSPDGIWLAVTGAHPADGRSAVWIVNAELGDARLLVDHPGADHSPRWSPDGSTIAFISGRDGRDTLCAAPADGIGPAFHLTYASVGQDDHDPVWASGGSRIAFARKAAEAEQTGDHIWTVTLATGEAKQITKRLAARRSLTWAPDRALIMHIAEDGDWENVAVVNPDNAAGWNIASEYNDKASPRWSADGARVTYTRTKDGFVRCCERGTSSASAETIDPGDGVAKHPRFLADKRVLYAFTPATGPTRFIAQAATADAERTELPTAVPAAPVRALVAPTPIEFDVNGRKLGGLSYRMSELSGPVPAVVYLGDDPERPLHAAFDAVAQALAAAGLAVYVPSLPGTPGYGKKIANGLKETAGTEAEAADLLGILEIIRSAEGVDKHRLAVAGTGHGGALALTLAGSRPGQVQAVAAIDPVADWDTEFDNAGAERRRWLVDNLGVPAASRGAYTLRTPSTFVGVIDAPILLVGTDRAPNRRTEQIDLLTADMRELDMHFEHEVATLETDWETGARVAAFLRRTLAAVVPPADPRMDDALAPEAV
ncbi:MAG: S9 family peptidase [Thermomicrobiales bacterium]